MIDAKKHSTDGKRFFEYDVIPCRSIGFYGRISCLRNDLIYNPPDWMLAGRQETSSGYGRRLNSGYSIRFEGKVYRIYTTIFSNSGTCWFQVKGWTDKGRRIIVDAN